ncbi:MAG: CAP domain-containing protein [Propioniciclava sp.]
MRVEASVTEVITLTNSERTAAGLAPLRMNPCLADQVARPWGEHLARTGPLVHQDMQAALRKCPNLNGIGENLAAGQNSPREAVTDWMNSPGHRANLMNPSFDEIGVVRVVSGSGKIYWVQIFGQ